MTVTLADVVTAARSIPRDAEGYATASPSMGAGTTSGSRRSVLRRYLHWFADGRCVVCGENTLLECDPKDPRRAEGGHIVPAGDNRGGYFPGNLANMCRDCNFTIGNRDMTDYLERFHYWQGIPLQWPGWKELDERFPAQDHSSISAYRAILRRAVGI